ARERCAVCWEVPPRPRLFTAPRSLRLLLRCLSDRFGLRLRLRFGLGLGFLRGALLDDQHGRTFNLLRGFGAMLRELLGHRLAEIGWRLDGARAGLLERAE